MDVTTGTVMSIEVILNAAAKTPPAPDAIALSADAALVLDTNGASAVLDMNGAFFGISTIGAVMLKGALLHGREATANMLAQRFGVEPARIATDLDRLITDLQVRGVIHGHSTSKTPRRLSGAAFAARFLAGIFRITRKDSRRAVASLVLSRLSFALFGWKATIDAWRSRFPERKGSETAQASAIDAVVRHHAARIWIGIDCKERALSCFALARAAGLSATLHVGVALHPLGGHCWCRVGSQVVGDDAENCDRYLPVFRYA
jgi:hypothetical protein